MAVKYFILLALLQLTQCDTNVECQETECVTLTVEMQEGISEIKNGLADLKEAVASLAKEQAELVSVLSMIKDNITDLKDCRENLKTEILNKTADPGSEDKESGQYYSDCKDAYEHGEIQSGVFTIKPDGGPSFVVYCNMEVDGGGWTVFQRRQDGSQDFFLYWDDYERGFGNLIGKFWLGLSYIHRLTASATSTQLRIDLADFTGSTKYAKYSEFAVGDSDSNYVLTVTGYSGDAGDSIAPTWRSHSGRQFTARDRDNDRYSNNCAVLYTGAWWFNKCHHSHLNGVYLNGSHGSYANGIIWVSWKGYHYSLKFTEMKLRRA